MWSFAIPAICVIAHLYVVLLFLPGLWREIDERGFRWHNAVALFALPAMVIFLIGSHLLNHLDTLPGWLLVVGFLTIDALAIAIVLAAVGLRSQRRRLA